MQLKKNQEGTVLTVSLEGDLDTVSAPVLEKKLQSELDGVEKLIFDLSELEYVSSAGLRVFLSMQKKMRTQGSMVIRNTNEEVMDIFKVTGFVKLLHIEK